MKKLTSIIKSFNVSSTNNVCSVDEMNFRQHIDESLQSRPGYSKDNSSKILEDLKKLYGTDFESAKQYFDQNFQ